MGPRPKGRGNSPSSRGHERALFASMGPRPKGRGNRPPVRFPSAADTSFNGAAAEGPRKSRPVIRSRNFPSLLQWGRGRRAAEIGRFLVFFGSGLLLQWGRGRRAAEMLSTLGYAAEQAGLQWGRGRRAAEIDLATGVWG